ncbi:histidine phosphatase family protein [Dichotomicrobium thermohalophilum]|uniref:Putative phosphoglycerate mutase n=1 Tax=Dichotomicrobium thermohalophilum TaxID=933063 RepID=A0A397Q565_9HYPH|nr:histidine phosphatase family protein [Dichotomicrobium thermohalophilum]RIA56093.1 putative phosphoglycerate mutase [Dichotomicrobium thermohalophilum]
MRLDGVTIYFVRHGQTDWNAEARFQGHLDIPLNDTGRAQAARNGAVLARVIGDPADFDFVSSPLSRASETMQIVRRALAVEPTAYRTDRRLREINGGDNQGKLPTEVVAAIERYAGRAPADRWGFQHPGGESYAMLYQRVCDWLESVKRDTVVTAHGGVMRCLRRYVEGLDPEATLQMAVPQDKVLVIRAGALDWI